MKSQLKGLIVLNQGEKLLDRFSNAQSEVQDIVIGVQLSTLNSVPVFFDIFGLIVISYPRWINVFINLSIVSLALFAMYTDVSDFSKKTDVYKVALEFEIVNNKRILYNVKELLNF